MVYKFYYLENLFYNLKIVPFAILIRMIMRILFSCDIPYKTKIGKGTKFPHHALGVVIHQDVVIGNNCKILQGVSIGGRSDYSEVPVIGSNVLIGANATIIGPIKIGNNVKIGAGSVVTHDVKDGDVVAGNPARKLK